MQSPTATPPPAWQGAKRSPAMSRRHGVALDNQALTSAGLRSVIRIQGIVRARMAAKNIKKKVKTHMIRTKIAAELLSTERSYIKDLIVVVDEFYMPLSSLLSQEQLDTLFSNLKEIISVHAKFIDTLEKRLNNWGYNACVADAVIPFVQDFKCYEKYINNFSKANEFLLAQTNEGTAAGKLIKKKTKESKACRGLTLSSFLIMPVQRLPRVILLLKELIKYTPSDHPDMTHCHESHNKMSQVTESLNLSKKNADNKEKFRSISKSVSGLNLKEDSFREFVHEGTLDEVVANKGRAKLTASSSDSPIEKIGYYVFLFSDVLLCAKRLSAPARVMANLGKREATYQFSTPSLIPLYDTTVAKLDETNESAFKIEYQDPDNDNRVESRIFCAANDAARDKWIQIINAREKQPLNNE